jgi:ligand-binding sensor domain-containing protein
MDGNPPVHVRSLFEDQEGRIWAGGSHGLALVDAAGGAGVVLGAEYGLANRSIQWIGQTPDRQIWVSDRSGQLFGRADQTFVPLPRHGSATGEVTAMLTEPGRSLWIAMNPSFLQRVDREGTFCLWPRARPVE